MSQVRMEMSNVVVVLMVTMEMASLAEVLQITVPNVFFFYFFLFSEEGSHDLF